MTTINRAPFNLLVDEPVGGPGLTGTTWNKNQIKGVLLDPIDVALAQVDAKLQTSPIVFPAVAVPSANPNTLDDYEEGQWMPADGSGAGLVFAVNSAGYCKVGQECWVSLDFSWPANSNGLQARITGLPFATNIFQSALHQGYGPLNLQWLLRASNLIIEPYDMTGNPKTNAQVSGCNFVVSGVYRTNP